MAKKINGEVNRSQAIRDMIAANPAAQTQEIIALLAKKGIKVSSDLVYFVRGKAKRQKRRQKRLQVAETYRSMGLANPVELILSVKRLATDAGGIRKLKELVDALAE